MQSVHIMRLGRWLVQYPCRFLVESSSRPSIPRPEIVLQDMSGSLLSVLAGPKIQRSAFTKSLKEFMFYLDFFPVEVPLPAPGRLMHFAIQISDLHHGNSWPSRCQNFPVSSN